MINHKVETEASFSNNHDKSESVACKKKLKKVRSIRLLRFPSMRSSSGGRKSQYENLYMLSSVATETSNQPTPIQMSDASPNYMKGTSSSHAKESFQITERVITKKTLTRVSTLKLMRNVTRKLSGRTELKRKLKPSRSTKLATVKGQKSTRNQSELIHGRDGQSWKRTGDIQPHSTYAGNKSQRVITRRLSLKPVRILTKMPTFKSKNDSSLNKATCSSTLKDSHFPDHIDLPQEGSGSQGVSAMKVCPYSYCSLHGHRHNNLPPLKRFVSMRRRLLKTQKSTKMDGRPVTRSKQSGDRRKATQKTRTVHNGVSISHSLNSKKLARDSSIWLHDTPESTVTEGGTFGGEDEESYNFRCDAEVLLGETSSPHMTNFEEHLGNSLAEKGCTYLAIKETDMECCCIATEKDKSDSKVTETARNDKNRAAYKKNDESTIVESTSIDVVKSAASDVEIFEGEATTKCKNMEQDYVVMHMSSAQKEPESACTTDVAYRMQEREHKYVRMWHLMYKHAMLSNTGKEKHKLPFDGRDKEGRGQDSQSFDIVNNSSCQDYYEADQDMGDENKNVIELVQKAFDEILLPEPEGFSSDDDCKSSGIGSEEVLLEKSEGNRGERDTSASGESPKEETWLKVDNFRSHVDEITAQQTGTKPDHKTPKRWSNLKKLILLKRFVKALEKVRNFSLQRPRHFPSDANLEAEKVFLRHQTAEEKKNADEWMLDYALQKVISKLAPAQRQRVALLVEAFESILPFQDAENVLQSSATAETQANPAQSIDYPSDHSKEETDKGRDYGYSDKMLIGKASCSHNSVMEFGDNASDNPMPELLNPIMVFNGRCLDHPVTNAIENRPASGVIDEYLNQRQSLASNCDNGEKISTDKDSIHLAEIKDSRSWSSSKPAEIMGSCHEEAPTNEIVNEVPDDLISISNTEIPASNSESPGRDFESENLIGADREQFFMTKSLVLKGLVRSFGSDLVGSGAPSDLLDEPTADRKERIEKAKLETGTLKGLPTDEQSEVPKSVVVEPETRIEKQNNTGLWYLVYKHMASDIAETDSKTLTDGEDEKESGYEGSRTRGTSVSYESTPIMNQDMHFKDHGVADLEVELQQIEVIKMVEEAIDSILPDARDDLMDRQSLNDNTFIGNCSKQSNRTERLYSEGLNHKEEKMAYGNGITQEEEQEPAPKQGNKSNQQLPRSWSNLKKVILLRRFIKALEKVRKFNPRGPRYLPIEPDSEAEKVNLRHQDMAERKGTEEWMLDYALRQVVSKLTPARKRKVELLVEAFETVTPSLKN